MAELRGEHWVAIVVVACWTIFIAWRMFLARMDKVGQSLGRVANAAADKLATDPIESASKKKEIAKIQPNAKRDKVLADIFLKPRKTEVKQKKQAQKAEKARDKRAKRITGINDATHCEPVYFCGPYVKQDNSDNFEGFGGICKMLPKILEAASQPIRDTQERFTAQMALLETNPYATLRESVDSHSIYFVKLNKSKIRESFARLGSFLGDDLLDLVYQEITTALSKKEKSICMGLASVDLAVKRLLFGFLFVTLDYSAEKVFIHQATYSYRLFLLHEVGQGAEALELSLLDEMESPRMYRLTRDSEDGDS